MKRAPAKVLAGCLLAPLLVGACASDSPDHGRELLVSAAASLTDAFAEVEAAFEQTNPGIDVVLNLGGSSLLREQILGGAPTGVFASADASNMNQVDAAGRISGDPEIFVRNRLQIAVPAGNPAQVAGLGDFDRDELLIGLCAENVPCGDLARQALEKAGVNATIDTNESNVRALITKIRAGELDAGIVYVTDIAATDGTVQGISIPEEHNVMAEYPIAVVAGAVYPAEAAAFVEFVLSDAGRLILDQHGFSRP